MASEAPHELQQNGVKLEASVPDPTPDNVLAVPSPSAKPPPRSRRKKGEAGEDDSAKRRCVSTACIACRKRKSKCDGNTPACAACKQVYGTRCVYDPNSDYRRKGVYKNDADSLKTKTSTLRTLMHAIVHYPEAEAIQLVQEIRTCGSLDVVAERIAAKENEFGTEEEDEHETTLSEAVDESSETATFAAQLYGKIGDLRLDDGSVRFIGGTSNLIHLSEQDYDAGEVDDTPQQHGNPITSWTTVTDDPELVLHLLNMYWTWHASFFSTISKHLFYRDFNLGCPSSGGPSYGKTTYCSALLVNAILALGCHFTPRLAAMAIPGDDSTAGDHFFREAKRLMMENDEHERPRLTTVQAMALMSVREAGCGREAKGWVYSGMAFRMACDMGLHLNTEQLPGNKHVCKDEAAEDARRITFWGCYLFDKCWSNYLGRLPQLPTSLITVPKVDVFPDEDASTWMPYTESGFAQAHAQPARTRAVSLQITTLCEISSDLMTHFYNPSAMEKGRGKSTEFKMLANLHSRLESWRRELPHELEARDGALPSVLVMHMFFQLLLIHLFRPFLKYTKATSPLPLSVSPRKLCTQAAMMISKLMRLYKRSHGLRQICNITVYIIHSACTIHLLNLPDRNAKRDIIHGVKHLEEIAEGWLCARRTLAILSHLASRWKIELPEDAAAVLARTDIRFQTYRNEVATPSPQRTSSEAAAHTMQMPNVTAATTNFTPQQMGASNGRTNLLDRRIRAALPGSTYTAATSEPNSAFVQRYPQLINPLLHQTQRTAPGSQQPITSPSDILQGVDQLLPESNNWVFRDQAQMASGFENWPIPAEADVVMWPDGAYQGSITNLAVPANEMSMPAMDMNYLTSSNDGSATYTDTNWANAASTYTPIPGYRPEEYS